MHFVVLLCIAAPLPARMPSVERFSCWDATGTHHFGTATQTLEEMKARRMLETRFPSRECVDENVQLGERMLPTSKDYDDAWYRLYAWKQLQGAWFEHDTGDTSCNVESWLEKLRNCIGDEAFSRGELRPVILAR